MYPNFYYLFQDLFGVEWKGLVFINTFGFFVALGFLAANWLMTIELRRKESEGLIHPKEIRTQVGGPLSAMDLVSNALLGFVIGWKFLYLILNAGEFFDDPQSHILSTEGSVFWGVVLSAAAVAWKFYEHRALKKKYPQPVTEVQMQHPYQIMGTLTLVAAVAGFIGAKLFDHLEHWDDFVKNPLAAFLDPFSGLTFYGGLICGGAAVLWYASKNGINWRIMLDVGGPAMMMAYAVGRIGCHMSGDGDWGKVNPTSGPSWLPDWLWSYTYPNNVARICDPFTGARCMPGEDVVLSAGVWPTPIYETIMGIILFTVLWSMRKRIRTSGVLFSIYMIFAGVERFLIEKIRVNIKYHFGSLDITQAELISIAMILVGIAGVILFTRNAGKHPESDNAANAAS
ncbi:MAG: prolipoprotein diacylglyceryl transferase [Flavobacteriales bacterium]|nr:prolipoprotein diacylglyceryl transferase [Flavobacteriales bacterium]